MEEKKSILEEEIKEKFANKLQEIDEESKRKNTPENNEWYIDSEKYAYTTDVLNELLEDILKK